VQDIGEGCIAGNFQAIENGIFLRMPLKGGVNGDVLGTINRINEVW
jgi:hypothetical protein